MPRKEEACPEMQRQEQKSFSCQAQNKPVPQEGRSLNSNPRSWPPKAQRSPHDRGSRVGDRCWERCSLA